MSKFGTLLLVDDEKEIGETLTILLEPLFDKIIFCQSAVEALEIASKNQLTAIMTDLSMPDMKGDEFVRKLRSQGVMTPIMFLTAHASKEVVLSAMRLGVSDVFEKPFNTEDLISSIERVLEIDKRSEVVRLDKAAQAKDETSIKREKKILGLLRVVNEGKKRA